MDVQSLPTLNAFLNATSAVLLVIGYKLIRSGQREAHRKVMLAAFAVSTVFLASYLTHHYLAGIVYFKHDGWLRTVYQTILLTHTVLAATVPVLAIISLRRAWAGKFPAHRKIARWTLPIWLYVSVTGVVVYLMLYQM